MHDLLAELRAQAWRLLKQALAAEKVQYVQKQVRRGFAIHKETKLKNIEALAGDAGHFEADPEVSCRP